MVERQPGRPTEEEFDGAARRFLRNDYKIVPTPVSQYVFINVVQVMMGKSADIDIIKREQEAEGKPGEFISMTDFALNQLAAYQKSQKH